MEADLIFKLLIGALGGLARSLFHYIKKVKGNPELDFDIGMALWSVGRAVVGAAIVVSSMETTNPISLITAGLTADVIGKDFFSYVQNYFKDRET